MSDKHGRQTLLCLPQVGGFTRSSQLLPVPLDATAGATARQWWTSEHVRAAEQAEQAEHDLGTSLEHHLDMQYIVSRLLAEGDDIEDTLTRVCAVLRDSMGWNEVAFRPADGHLRVLPSVSAVIRIADGHTCRHPSLAPADSAWHTFSFPVRGTHALLGVIECRGAQPDSPDSAILSAAASLGPAIGRFIERQREVGERRDVHETEHMADAENPRWVSQLKAVFEALADSVVIFAPDGHILYTNAADHTMFAYDQHSDGFTTTLRERGRLLALRDEHDHPFADDCSPLMRVLRGETFNSDHAVEAMLRTPDGRDMQVSISGAPLYDEKGNLIGGVVVTRDVTERRNQERALLDANRRMKEFLAVAAHDLRTPITSSRGYIQFSAKRLDIIARAVASENPPLATRIEDVLRNLDDAERSTQRLAALVDRLLDVARIQANKLELRPEATDLAAIVRTAVDEQRLALPTRVIRCKLPPTLAVPTYADPTRIGQVLMNYLANALKYSPEDSTVEVMLDVRQAEARVAVRDAGPGVPRAKQKHIWSRFEQLGGVPQHGFDTGLGLGLYISRAIVEAHGGQVGVKSAAGHGSTFWFSLPLARSIG